MKKLTLSVIANTATVSELSPNRKSSERKKEKQNRINKQKKKLTQERE